jgi:hypothetical protein
MFRKPPVILKIVAANAANKMHIFADFPCIHQEVDIGQSRPMAEKKSWTKKF